MAIVLAFRKKLEERCTGGKKLLEQKLNWHLHISTEKKATCQFRSTLKFMRLQYQPRKPIRTNLYQHRASSAFYDTLPPSHPVVYCIWKLIQSESCVFNQIDNIQLLWLTFHHGMVGIQNRTSPANSFCYYANNGQEIVVLFGALIRRWEVCCHSILSLLDDLTMICLVQLEAYVCKLLFQLSNISNDFCQCLESRPRRKSSQLLS